ncbi:MAG TPA: glycerol-3-phosphate dehydrogenase/oxidase [Chloroflexia bacterium]|nr:glycerol-3-phosphate dehydrogenase/oxidase [Chloroflexia bacterium]
MRQVVERNRIWGDLARPWDVLVIGGGITGAGIFREAARSGLRTLLVEQRDFAWGASGRSSSLVHGGLRYLFQGRFGLTRDAVRGREKLLALEPGLVEPIGYLAPDYGRGKTNKAWHLAMRVALGLYDLFAGYWRHRYYSADEFRMLAPGIDQRGLKGGFGWRDAQTDDARLVWHVLQEGMAEGGVALNYVAADTLLRDAGQVTGAVLRDHIEERTAEVRAHVVINATGAWADRLRTGASGREKMRPLRGSHLIFPGWRIPVAQAIAIYHPADGRPVSVVPWEGCTRVGTTDLDHDLPLDQEPRISPAEVAYLMAAVESLFPGIKLTLDDVVSTYAGIRPVIGTKGGDPSSASRDYAIWEEDGLITITGGKLTTFHHAASDILAIIRRRLPYELPDHQRRHTRSATRRPSRRLAGRYGNLAARLLEEAQEGELERVPGTETVWAELRWAARTEMVVHLDDLLLRRTRLGQLLPRGGEALLPAIRLIIQQELGWDDARWNAEAERYMALWRTCYSLSAPETIPDWRSI